MSRVPTGQCNSSTGFTHEWPDIKRELCMWLQSSGSSWSSVENSVVRNHVRVLSVHFLLGRRGAWPLPRGL